MRLDLEAGGKTITVEIRSTGAGLVVAIDGRERRVEASWISSRELSLLVDGRSFTAEVQPAGPSAVEVSINGHRIRVGQGAGEGARDVAVRHHEGGGALRAPMPGKIVTVLVQPGDTVAAGQGLVVIEAMKMENELQASAAGTVRTVHVQTGQVVEGGAILVELG